MGQVYSQPTACQDCGEKLYHLSPDGRCAMCHDVALDAEEAELAAAGIGMPRTVRLHGPSTIKLCGDCGQVIKASGPDLCVMCRWDQEPDSEPVLEPTPDRSVWAWLWHWWYRFCRWLG